MCPDNENHSALYHCIEMENLKSFEYIIEILTDFHHICLTNRLIRFIPLMLNRRSDSFMNFFNKLTFKTLSMENTLLINWNNNPNDEFIFLSNTSIISKELIQKEMVKKGFMDPVNESECGHIKQNYLRQKITRFELMKKALKIC